MIRDNRHDAAYLFGAICPARGVGAAIVAPAAALWNLDTVSLFHETRAAAAG